MVTFVILLLVAGCIILALYYLQARYDIRLSNFINAQPSEEELGFIEIYHDGLGTFRCCNHCFTEDGEMVHPRNFMDKHTVACNEKYCSQGSF